MNEWRIIQDIVVLLAAAGVSGLLFERLRQSAIIGHLVAGTVVGPALLGLVAQDSVSTLAELGVALLLFTIGLEISWKRFRELGLNTIVAGNVQILATVVVVASLAIGSGRSWQAAIVLGGIVALSSTATVIRALSEKAELESLHGRASLAILLVQDAAVVPLVLLATFLGTGEGLSQILAGLSIAAVKGLVLVFALILVGAFLMPRILSAAARAHNRELPTILAVASCLAATYATHAAGLSPALGAFVAGVVLAGSPMATQMRAELTSLRTVFVTLFFASMGMLADLQWLLVPANAALVVALVIAVLVIKSVIVYLSLRSVRTDRGTAAAAGLCVAQVGEFSFVLAGSGVQSGLFGKNMFQAVVTTTIVTLLLTPAMVAQAHGIGRRLARATGGPRLDPEVLKPHVIVVGYGPAGREVIKALRDAKHAVTLVESNPRTAASAQREGVHTVVGNVSAPEVLEHAGLDTAITLVITIPDHRTAALAIDHAASLHPDLRILARGRYHLYVNVLRAAGASEVIDEEEMVGRILGMDACAAAFATLAERAEEDAEASA